MTARDLHERHGNEELRRRALTRAHSHLPSRTMRLFVPLERRTLARQLHSPVGMIDLIGRMCVGIDAHHAATFKLALVPAPIQIEPPWIGIDFNGDAARRAG